MFILASEKLYSENVIYDNYNLIKTFDICKYIF